MKPFLFQHLIKLGKMPPVNFFPVYASCPVSAVIKAEFFLTQMCACVESALLVRWCFWHLYLTMALHYM